MKYKAFLFLLVLAFSFKHLSAQVLIDTSTGPIYSSNIFPIADNSGNHLYVGNTNSLGLEPVIIVYNPSNLIITDTIKPSDAGRHGGRFYGAFTFNSNAYSLCTELNNPALRNFSIHKFENGMVTDSFGLNLDSIPDAYPNTPRQIDKNTIQILIDYYPTTGPASTGGVLYLDSNFTFKEFHEFDYSNLPPTQRRMLYLEPLSSSNWHAFFKDRIATYNPTQKAFIFNDTVTAKIKNSFTLDSTKYIALGTVSTPVSPVQSGWSQTPGVGFYKLNQTANILDTIVFNAYQDTVPSLGINNYSMEDFGTSFKNSVIYDSNSIYLASSGSYFPWNSTTNTQYFYIIKTNLSGDLIWHYIFGGVNNMSNFGGVCKTSDNGIVVSGAISRNSVDYAILFKFGPDGNLSNLEFTALEDVIQFYPNPIKNKLNYSFVENDEATFTLEITDIQGRQTTYYTLNNQNQSIDVNLRPGFYIYQVKDRSSKVAQIGKFQVIK